jgi:putative ABC transport system ATP-binding protein
MGPSGSGKTTLLNMVVGAEEPDDGHIEGLPRRADWSYLAIVPQALGLLNELTILENVTLPLRLGASASTSAAELMDQLGIAHLTERSPHETSLGEQQRAAVARSLLPAPTIVVADEPTSHQDEANAHRVIDAFAACAAAGSSILLATHDIRVIDRCDVVLGVTDGQVLPVR